VQRVEFEERMETWTLDFVEAADREAILVRAQTREFSAGAVVIARGSKNESLHFVQEGFVRVQRDIGGDWLAVARMGPGEFFGEMSLLENAPASATIVADGRVRLASIHLQDLTALADLRPGFRERLYRSLARVLSQRLRALGGFVATLDRTSEQRHQALFERLQPPDPDTHQVLRARSEDLANALAEGSFRVALGEDPREVYPPIFDSAQRLLQEHGASAARVLHTELYATWMRSPTIAGSLLSVGGNPRANPTLRRVLFNRTGGDGEVGQMLEEWVLARPTLAGLRWATDSLAARIEGGSFMLLGAVQGPTTRAVLEKCTSLVALDADEQALEAIHQALAGRPGVYGQIDLLDLVRGRGRLAMEPVDTVVGLGVLDSVPEEDLSAVLTTCRDLMRAGGTTWLSGTAPGEVDEALFRHLLHWPCHRRSVRHLEEAAREVGLTARIESQGAHLMVELRGAS
jgi:CRP-like cAMP-binding protein